MEKKSRATTRVKADGAPRTRPTKVEKIISDDVIKAARESGMLPHEILLKAARGEGFRILKLQIVKFKAGPNKGEEKERRWIDELYYPNFNEQIECAKAAAPYFAPRLTTQTITTDDNTTDALTEVMKQLASKLPV